MTLSALPEPASWPTHPKHQGLRDPGIPEPPAHYGRGMRTSVEPDELRDLLHDRGLKARLYVDEDREWPNAFIESGSSGLSWFVLLLDHRRRRLSIFELYGILAKAFDDPLRLCNDYNRGDVVCAAPAFIATNDDGDEVIKVRKIVTLQGGVDDEWLTNQLRLWEHAVTLFSVTYQRELSGISKNLGESEPEDEDADDLPVDPMQQLIARVEAGEDPAELLDGIVSELDAQGQRAQSAVDRLKNRDWAAFARDTYPFRDK